MSAAFLDLARRGFFDGLTFHRVVPGFVVQGGDPRGDGNGGPGFALRDEIGERPYGRGVVGMALSGKDTGGSQLFVTLAPAPHLDGALHRLRMGGLRHGRGGQDPAGRRHREGRGLDRPLTRALPAARSRHRRHPARQRQADLAAHAARRWRRRARPACAWCWSPAAAIPPRGPSPCSSDPASPSCCITAPWPWTRTRRRITTARPSSCAACPWTGTSCARSSASDASAAPIPWCIAASAGEGRLVVAAHRRRQHDAPRLRRRGGRRPRAGRGPRAGAPRRSAAGDVRGTAGRMLRSTRASWPAWARGAKVERTALPRARDGLPRRAASAGEQGRGARVPARALGLRARGDDGHRRQLERPRHARPGPDAAWSWATPIPRCTSSACEVLPDERRGRRGGRDREVRAGLKKHKGVISHPPQKRTTGGSTSSSSSSEPPSWSPSSSVNPFS